MAFGFGSLRKASKATLNRAGYGRPWLAEELKNAHILVELLDTTSNRNTLPKQRRNNTLLKPKSNYIARIVVGSNSQAAQLW